MTINNILALNLTRGGYLNHNKKTYSERRNHGLSLTNLTHCISPSEYYNDYFSNNSFNKINLQLHASSVSNPYSFSIKSDTKFSGSVQSALPTADTELLHITNDDYPFIESFTVPTGCKVVRAFVADKQGREAVLRNQYSDIQWSYYNIGAVVECYVGVTPGKTYTLVMDAENTDYAEAYVYYSASINTHTPDVTDY